MFPSLGDIVGNIGSALHLPEFGISEALNGQSTATPTAAQVAGVQPNSGYSNPTPAPPQQQQGQGQTQQQQQQQQDPNAAALQQQQAAARQTAAANAAAYNNQANQFQNQYNTLDGQLNTGMSNINNGYNHNLNNLNDSNAIATRNYNTAVGNNNTSFLSTKNGILSNTRSSSNSLQRLLGLNGAGNSSAAFEQAPYAAALQGTTALNGAQDTYAKNQAGLDTNYGDTQNAFKKQQDALNQNKFQQQQQLNSSIANNRVGLLNQIASAKQQAALAGGQSYAQAQAGTQNYQSQINDLLKQITSYGNEYKNPVALNTNVSYNAPALTNYTLGQQAVATNGQGGQTADIATPFLSLLANKDKNTIGAF